MPRQPFPEEDKVTLPGDSAFSPPTGLPGLLDSLAEGIRNEGVGKRFNQYILTELDRIWARFDIANDRRECANTVEDATSFEDLKSVVRVWMGGIENSIKTAEGQVGNKIADMEASRKVLLWRIEGLEKTLSNTLLIEEENMKLRTKVVAMGGRLEILLGEEDEWEGEVPLDVADIPF